MNNIAVMYKDDRQRLTAQIEEWNSNRLDLFALSQPNEVRGTSLFLRWKIAVEFLVVFMPLCLKTGGAQPSSDTTTNPYCELVGRVGDHTVRVTVSHNPDPCHNLISWNKFCGCSRLNDYYDVNADLFFEVDEGGSRGHFQERRGYGTIKTVP